MFAFNLQMPRSRTFYIKDGAMPRTSRPEYPQGAKDEVSQSVSLFMLVLIYACFVFS